MSTDPLPASSPQFRPGAFLPALVAGAAVALSSPFMGEFRSALKEALPAQFAGIVAGAVVVPIALAVLAAAVRIRDRRGPRYAAVGGAVVAATLSALAVSSGDREVDAVERFHFVEYGLVTFLFYRAWRPVGDRSLLLLPLLCSLLVATLDEALQWYVPVRVGEMHDILMDAAASACGLLFTLGVDPPRFPAPMRNGSLARLGTLTALATLALAGFVDVVHLGYLVRDVRIGQFRSRFTTEELARAALARAALWRASPPITLRRLSREDQYMTEGIWHVQRRNEAWLAGDWVAGWHENQILETYYSPLLDTPSYVSRAGLRWSDGQRADAARRAEGDRRPWVSSAERSAILLWSKTRFRSLVIAVSCGIVVLFRWLDRRQRLR